MRKKAEIASELDILLLLRQAADKAFNNHTKSNKKKKSHTHTHAHKLCPSVTHSADTPLKFKLLLLCKFQLSDSVIGILFLVNA